MQYQQTSLRTQRIIEHLEKKWKRLPSPSTEVLKRVTELAVSLQEEYQIIGLQQIAEHTISNMHLHMLNLIEIFRQRADQEGICAEDVRDTLDYILPETFQTMANVSKHLNIKSLDDLTVLVNMTASLQVLSRTESAAIAQSWLYELPRIYYGQLMQEGLVSSEQILNGKLPMAQSDADHHDLPEQHYSEHPFVNGQVHTPSRD